MKGMALIVWMTWFVLYLAGALFFGLVMRDAFAGVLLLGASCGWFAFGLWEMTRSLLRR